MFRVHYKILTGKDIGLTFFGNSNLQPTIGEIRRFKRETYEVISYNKL